MPRLRAFTHSLRTPHVVALTVVIAAISLLWGVHLHADPSGWLRWGKEISAGGGRFDTTFYPSWKPLPVLFTVPLALAGPAAPALWLMLLRTSGLLAIVLVFRLARDLGGVAAGWIAAVTLALVPSWWSYALGGHIEPLLLVFLLLAVERHRAGRPMQAMGLGVLVALGREEAAVLLAIYGAFIVLQDRRRLPLVALLLLAIPLAWFGGDWLGSGDPVRGATLAQNATDTLRQLDTGTPMAVQAFRAALDLFLLPVWFAAAAGFFVAWRRRQMLVLWLGVAGAGWLVFDVFITAFGYPVESRFMLPAAGLLTILAGVGGGRVTEHIRRNLSAVRV